MNKRIRCLSFMTVFLFGLLLSNVFYLTIIKNSYYKEQLNKMTNVLVSGDSAVRGKIYDRNHNLLVDNISRPAITYKKDKNISQNMEIKIVSKLAKILDLSTDNLSNIHLKEYYMLKYKEKVDSLITDREIDKYNKKQLTNDDLTNLKLSRIDLKKLNLSNEVKKEAYIYYLMNNGYSYKEKVIKEKAVSDKEIAYIKENIGKLKGINIVNKFERIYPYNDTFKKILGNIGNIPFENKEYYLKNGYTIFDIVGLSYLEKQYDNYLRGTNAIYKKVNNKTLELVKEAKRGNDLVLSIDINLQKRVDDIIKEEIIATKFEPNTYYFNNSNVVIIEPNTGEILAMSGKSLINNDFHDYTEGIFLNPMTVGSVVKGASMLVGYNNNGVKIGEVKLDECIKIAATPKKCSHMTLGYINDLEALAFSSNVYQFKSAIKVGKGVYNYNGPLKLDSNVFNIYRNTFKEFGLGVKTGIDLPIESLGYTSKSTLSGHLLDFVMGQFDTYTPIQLSQYINTFASDKKRIAPTILKTVYKGRDDFKLKDSVYKQTPKVLNTVKTDDIYFNRVLEGLKYTTNLSNGTANGYIYSNLGSGKTGTSQSFLDTNSDGVIDKETISTAFVGFMPSNNPKFSIAVTSPNVSFSNNYYFISQVTKRISHKISSILLNEYM
ncbi:MAG: penicillin-binding protein 2 [Bacilli bacterium]